MLKRTGNAKLIDVGSAFERGETPALRACTPAYAAPEVLEGAGGSPQSDLASLGYILIAMLAGAPPPTEPDGLDGWLDARRWLVARLPEILPEEVVRNELLMSLIGGLIVPDLAERFPSAEAVDLVEQGAVNF